ncbi:MAG: HAD-IA family hydrolase [Candidatus Wallbacteria bacterium]|nr:HAD-IA family hydrolase [Candidatus Wallbacteria bacterium]
MNFKTVIFDLDGTLLDTIQDIAYSMNTVLERHHFAPHSSESYKMMVGDGAVQLVQRALPHDCRDNRLAEQLAVEFRETYARFWSMTTCLYPGVTELLDTLTSLEIKIGVLSNKDHEFTVRAVRVLLPGWFFDAVEGAREGKPHKPDPLAVQSVLEKMNSIPGETVMIGDSDHDIISARQAGVFAVGALWGYRDRAVLERAGADMLIGNPVDLLKLLLYRGS